MTMTVPPQQGPVGPPPQQFQAPQIPSEKSVKVTFEVHRVYEGSVDHYFEGEFLSKADADAFRTKATNKEVEAQQEPGKRRIFQKIVETTNMLVG